MYLFVIGQLVLSSKVFVALFAFELLVNHFMFFKETFSIELFIANIASKSNVSITFVMFEITYVHTSSVLEQNLHLLRCFFRGLCILD